MRVFVSPHAARTYMERVCSLVSERQAEAEIRGALRAPLFLCPSADGSLTLWGCLNRAGYPFLTATDPADEGAEFLLVRTVGEKWYWHEAKRHWRLWATGSRGRIRRDRLPTPAPLR